MVQKSEASAEVQGMTPADAHAFLRRAMRARRGIAQRPAGEVIYSDPHFSLSRSAFLFNTPGGASFGYERRGDLVLDCQDENKLGSEIRLYQWGTVYGAIGWLSGLIPLHASCIERSGKALAFTAESGVGKSTLAAALSRHGYALLCDDTLMLSSIAEEFHAIPADGPVKLTGKVAAKLGFDVSERVPFSNDKFYVDQFEKAESPMRLHDLILIEDGPDIRLDRITGSGKIELVAKSLYRGFVHAALSNPRAHSAMMLKLAKGIDCWRLVRPRTDTDPTRMADEIAAVLKELD